MTVDLRYSEVEEELRAAVRELLVARSPAAAVLARVETGEPYDPKLWRQLAGEMGLAGLAVPTGSGGAGASWREVAVVLEELGRAVAPVPYLGSAVIATRTLQVCGPSGAHLLGRLASGVATAAVAVPFGTMPGAPATAATVDGEGLSGTVRGVADAQTADVLLVPAGGSLWAVDGGDAGVRRTPVVSLDPTRPLCDVTLTAAFAVTVGDAAAVEAGLLAGAALLAAEQVGVAQWCLDTTVAYLKERYQFARPVGSFQALKHRLADVWVAVTQARAVARYAAGCLADDDPDLPVAAALAQAQCGPVAVHAAEECVQLHGGIGFTWEHPAHLYLKRARADAVAAGAHRAALGGLVDLTL
jgi:alkylation response protein AidB-like acyl-CoA dehydrogenase